MAFLSVDDEDFWGRDLKRVETIEGEGGTQGLTMSHFAFGKPGEDHYPTMTALRMEPGFLLPRHAHGCYRLEVIVQGSMEVDGRILKPGSLMISEPDELYGPHVAGPDGCTTLEIFSSNTAENHITLEEPTGPATYDIRIAEDAARIVANLKRQMMART